jgi:DNA-directed RNA polymerase subunit omega
MAAKRVRQIREGSEYLVNSPKNEDIVVALREIAAGKVSIRLQIEEEPTAPQIQEATPPPDADTAEATEATEATDAAEATNAADEGDATEDTATTETTDEAEAPSEADTEETPETA